MDQVMEELKKTKFYKRMFQTNGDEVLCIYVSGSRIYGLEDEDSDYDIGVVTRTNNEVPNVYIGYKEQIGIEWFNNPLSSYSSISDKIHTAIRNFEINFLKDEHIIFRGKNYQEFLSLRNNNKDNGTDIGLKNLFNLMQVKYIMPILTNQEDLLPKKTKYLYHLCIGYHYMSNTPWNRDYILQVKKTHYKELSQPVKQYVINCLRWLGTHIK